MSYLLNTANFSHFLDVFKSKMYSFLFNFAYSTLFFATFATITLLYPNGKQKRHIQSNRRQPTP